ncbi:MAG: hypothetical protein J6Z31_07695 [Fibrobacter sp.]|nr:hypothetical protein [Fibrobacter sp.]
MGNIIQTSGFEIQEGEAIRLLHAFPLIFDMNDTPSLLYRIDENLTVGATVSYRLVAGFRIINWKGFISSVQGNSWTVDLKQGPFSMFHAEHSIQNSNGFLECSDEFSYNGEAADVANVLENARVLYAFDARQKLFQAKDSFESRHETESFRAFSSGLSAG